MNAAARAESVMTCTACGASIYQEHIDRGLAGMWAGEMLCPACLREKKETGEAPEDASDLGLGSLPLMEEAATAADDDTPREADPPQFSIADVLGVDSQLDVPSPGSAGTGARHVRIFHAKLSEGAIKHLEGQVNTWLESHPEVYVKCANTTVGVWEAKHAEPNLILTIFY